MLEIETFDNIKGGNVVYKALAHPVAAARLAGLTARLNEAGPTAVYDPEGIAAPLLALNSGLAVAGVFVHDTLAVGQRRGGHIAKALIDLPDARISSVLVAGFDVGKAMARVRSLVPEAEIASLDGAKLPSNLITNPARYLDPLNFATNFAFFRDDAHFHTRLTSANYWAGYGARNVRFYLRLYDADGRVLAEWEEMAPEGPGGVVIDSREVRTRFALPPFSGQLFLHAVGAAGHDVVKYALDTFAGDHGASLSCTHDANAWPSERFAGLPAPTQGERVVLWVQNSHAVPIPPGAISLDRMGAEHPVPLEIGILPFASRAVDVASLLPGLQWPAQIELRSGRHVVRPRYEVTRENRTRIAHVNVERTDLAADPAMKHLSPALGRGYLLPFPVLARDAYRTLVLPTPMAEQERQLPLRLDVFSPEGTLAAQHYLGILPRDHALALDLDEVLSEGQLAGGGHAELVYDFREGGEANGWLHALFRYERRDGGHVAESSFGAHIFNTLMTYRGEPQSYSGPPPGLSTRLFLKLGFERRESFCVLIYPASAKWHDHSATTLQLIDGDGKLLAEGALRVACSGSQLVYPSKHFSTAELGAAGETGYVLIRDTTCRLFGFHGLKDDQGGFSLDHMFGF
jgi:hypothetical protein